MEGLMWKLVNQLFLKISRVVEQAEQAIKGIAISLVSPEEKKLHAG